MIGRRIIYCHGRCTTLTLLNVDGSQIVLLNDSYFGEDYADSYFGEVYAVWTHTRELANLPLSAINKSIRHCLIVVWFSHYKQIRRKWWMSKLLNKWMNYKWWNVWPLFLYWIHQTSCIIVRWHCCEASGESEQFVLPKYIFIMPHVLQWGWSREDAVPATVSWRWRGVGTNVAARERSTVGCRRHCTCRSLFLYGVMFISQTMTLYVTMFFVWLHVWGCCLFHAKWYCSPVGKI